MPHTATADHLNRLSTHWDEIVAAHGQGQSARAAQCAVLRRYCGAVYAFLVAATGDPHAAEDLAQEFALRFVRGDFHRLDPKRGRFREFVKAVLYHLAADHYRQLKAAPKPLTTGNDALMAGDPQVADEEFRRCWRDQLLARAWAELRNPDAEGSVGRYLALKWRVENPDRSMAEGAAALAIASGRAITPAALRQTLHRARQKFADLLRAEVTISLGTANSADVEAELADLGLLTYCRPAR